MRHEPIFQRLKPDKSGCVLDRKRVGQAYLHLLRVVLPLSVMAAGALFAWGVGQWEAAGIITVFGLGVLLVFATCFYECFFIGYYPARCSLRWLRERIDRRPDAIVKSDDPDACFVQMIPRENWTDAIDEHPSDVGLLVLDRGCDELRYEGDVERWTLPAESIRTFDLHAFKAPGPRGTTNEIAVVVMVVELDHDKTREIPLACHPIHLEFWSPGKSERGAELLRRVIGNLVDPGHWPPVPDKELWPLRPPKMIPEAIDFGEPTQSR
jgi:hypothetical protein